MTFPKNRLEMRLMRGALKFASFAAPLLKHLDVNLDRNSLAEGARIADTMLILQTEFNDNFAARGWVACGAVNVDAALEALKLAKEQRWAEADQVLSASYSAEYVRVHLGAMNELQCFASRLPLARLALQDYAAGRYHACVPLTLAIIDGTSKDLTGAGFFRTNLRVKPKESFLEIGPGIAALFGAMSRSRMSVSTESISIPYRHGIMHGTDLGYANVVVAAKAWAALLALGHYAKDFLEPPPKPGPRLSEVLREAAQTRAELDEMEAESKAWAPRSDAALQHVYASQQYSQDSPEAAVASALDAWRCGKWLLLAQASWDGNKPGVKAQSLASKLKNNLGSPPERFEVTAVEESWCSGWVEVRLVRGDDVQELRLRMLRIAANGGWPPKPRVARRWVMHNLWPLEAVFWSASTSDPEDAG